MLLEAQRFWADALANEYPAIVNYNKAIVGFEFAKGTILQHDNIVISEGALPTSCRSGAVEHQRERTAALVLRERAIQHGPAGLDAGVPGLPVLPDDKAPSLPALMKDAPGVPPPPPAVPDGGPAAKAPAAQPSATTVAAAKPKAKKTDPKKPSDFGSLRTASDTTTSAAAAPSKAATGTIVLDGPTASDASGTKASPDAPLAKTPALAPFGLPAMPTTPLPLPAK